MKRSRVSKSLMMAAACAAAVLALPSAALASSISGTVTAPGGVGIQGVEVCPSQPGGLEAPCAQTDPSGHYKTDSLAGGNYILRFSAERANLRYVSEFYDDKPYYWEADLFNLGPAEDKTLDVELAEGGSIGGTVTDETTGLPIAGVRACAIDEEGVPGRCADTDSNGEYLLNGLSSGSYLLDYEGGNRVNYLGERYKNPEGEGTGTAVEVTAPLTTANVDVKLSPGAQILGHVSEVGTGSPLANVRVCAQGEPLYGYQTCEQTDAAGNYALRSIPAGTYFVSFGVEYTPISGGQAFGQWWQGAATRAEATPITIAPPETRIGIDGQLPPKYQLPRPEPLQVTLIPAPPRPQPLHCRKGFRKKFVKGKHRCVKVHKRHHHRRRHGPRAHATGR